jgi:hypothetical protein
MLRDVSLRYFNGAGVAGALRSALIKNENSTYFSKVGKVQKPLFARVSADRFSLVKAAILIKIAFNKKQKKAAALG